MSEPKVSIINTDEENLEYLRNAKFEIYKLFTEVSKNFDGSAYQQGKKDGLRVALALLGNDGLNEFNSGGRYARK